MKTATVDKIFRIFTQPVARAQLMDIEGLPEIFTHEPAGGEGPVFGPVFPDGNGSATLGRSPCDCECFLRLFQFETDEVIDAHLFKRGDGFMTVAYLIKGKEDNRCKVRTITSVEYSSLRAIQVFHPLSAKGSLKIVLSHIL